MGFIKDKIRTYLGVDNMYSVSKDTSNINNEINRITNEMIVLKQKNDSMETEIRMLKNCILDMHLVINHEPCTDKKPQKVDNPLSLEECYEILERTIPNAFAVYEKLMENNKEAYVGLPLDSCVVKGHEQGDNFRRFLKRYLKGYVLDIGCGPQDIPFYLEGYDLEKIAGIDPLPPDGRHSFDYQQGIGEFIPWKDNSFDCIIFATSLDHVFLLDKVLEEVYRVSCNGGIVVLWVSFDPNAKAYNPYSTDFSPYDEYHMFHHSKEQFEKDMVKYFNYLEYFQSGPNTHFYAYEVRK